MPDPVKVFDDCDSSREAILTAVYTKDGNAVWIPVQGEHLANVFAELPRYPGMTLVKVGEPKNRHEEPVYIARGWYNGSLIPAYCGLHLRGAVVLGNGEETIVQSYQVLVAKPGQYIWESVLLNPFADLTLVVCGGITRAVNDQWPYTPIGRWRNRERGWVCRGIHSREIEPASKRSDFESGLPASTEILVRDASRSQDITVPVNSNLEPESRASVVVGRYWTGNHASHVVRGSRHSSAFNFVPPLQTAPRFLVGLSKLDMGAAAAIRIGTRAQNITKESFTCSAEAFLDTKLYNAAVDWAAVEEVTWQCGIFQTADLGRPREPADNVFDRRVTFPTHFTCPPMVLVCFNGVDVSGNWNLRTYATRVDHTGFNLSIVGGDDGDASTKLWSASITWLALPGEVLKRRNAWIGSFGTAEKGEIGDDGSWRGHVDFGFQFQRPPKVFLGLDHFRLINKTNLRLCTETTDVTVSGMDWKIWKWDNTVLKGASVSFLAVDCADR